MIENYFSLYHYVTVLVKILERCLVNNRCHQMNEWFWCNATVIYCHFIKYHNVVFIFFLSIYWVQLHMTSSYGNPSLHMTCQGYCIWSLIKMNKQFAHPWHKNIKISVTPKCRVALHFVFISLQIIWFIFYSWC